MRILILALLILTLASCGDLRTKPQIVATTPVAVNLVQRVYVPIDPQLTAPIAVPEGPLSQCPDVAAQRRGVIETLNARLEKISKIQETEVHPSPAAKK